MSNDLGCPLCGLLVGDPAELADHECPLPAIRLVPPIAPTPLLEPGAHVVIRVGEYQRETARVLLACTCSLPRCSMYFVAVQRHGARAVACYDRDELQLLEGVAPPTLGGGT